MKVISMGMNQTVIKTRTRDLDRKPIEVLYSHGQPVAYRKGRTYHVTESRVDTTTGRHLDRWLNIKEAKDVREVSPKKLKAVAAAL